MLTITLNDAIQTIKDNPYYNYVIRLNKDNKLVLSELSLIEDVLDDYNDIFFVKGWNMNNCEREYSNYYYLINNIQDLRIDLKILLDKNEDVEILKNDVLKLLRKYERKIIREYIDKNDKPYFYPL